LQKDDVAPLELEFTHLSLLLIFRSYGAFIIESPKNCLIRCLAIIVYAMAVIKRKNHYFSEEPQRGDILIAKA
jgi:hypothetical protein